MKTTLLIKKSLNTIGIVFFGATIALMLFAIVSSLFETADGKNIVKYSETTEYAQKVLDNVSIELESAQEILTKVQNQVNSLEQTACLQTVALAQLKYTDTSKSSLDEASKLEELDRLSQSALNARSACPELF